MDFVHKDINSNLIDYIEPEALSKDTAFFYASRRHWLEIVPEAITSGYMIFTWWVVVWNLGWLIESIWLKSLIVTWLTVILAMLPFGLEIFRWRREVYYLTQSGYFHSQFSLRSFNQVSEQIGWIASARAVRFGYYKLIGLDVGYFVARGADGRYVYSPLLPRPFVLQRRFSEIKNYQPKKS